MTFWCARHGQDVALCGVENRNCEHGRQTSPPPVTAVAAVGGVESPGPGSHSPASPGPGPLHLTLHRLGRWECWCGHLSDTPSDALYREHR